MGIIANLAKQLDVEEKTFAKVLADDLMENYNLKIKTKQKKVISFKESEK